MMNKEREMEILKGLVSETMREELTTKVLDILEAESVDNDSIIEFMEQVREYGCVSGMIGALTYYYQTDKFFMENMNDIFYLYNEAREHYDNMCPISAKIDVNANSLSWFAFESITTELLYLFYDKKDELEDEEEDNN